jgi:predicted molibdopterin-dependent oxidoreductase YjgC
MHLTTIMSDPPTRLLRRIAPFTSAAVTLYLDGIPLTAHEGETVLASVLCHAPHLRSHDVDASPRAGFCLMDACQDCWVWFSDGARGRACTTLVREGMRVSTSLPALP